MQGTRADHRRTNQARPGRTAGPRIENVVLPLSLRIDKEPFIVTTGDNRDVLGRDGSNQRILDPGMTDAHLPCRPIRFRSQKQHIAAKVDVSRFNTPFDEHLLGTINGIALGQASQIQHHPLFTQAGTSILHIQPYLAVIDTRSNFINGGLGGGNCSMGEIPEIHQRSDGYIERTA